MKKLLSILILLFYATTACASMDIGWVFEESGAEDFTQRSDCLVALLFNGDLTDETTNERDGTNNGATSLPISGKFGGCYDFEHDETDYVSLTTHITAFQSLISGTVMAYIKPESNTYGHWWAGGGSSSNWIGIAWYGNSTEGIWFAIKDDNTYDYSGQTSSGSVMTDNWYHIAITVENGVGNKIYINGVQVTPSYTYGNASSSKFFNDVFISQLWVGGSERGSFDTYFDGMIDEFAIFDVALNDTQISAIASHGLKGDQ